MMPCEMVYNTMERSDILIVNQKINHDAVPSLTVHEAGAGSIVIVDERKLETQSELKSLLLHEYGHCQTDGFYTENTSDLLRLKCEYRADKYIADNLITREMIDEAHELHGYLEYWEFAEHFSVTGAYMKRLLHIHFGMEFME